MQIGAVIARMLHKRDDVTVRDGNGIAGKHLLREHT